MVDAAERCRALAQRCSHHDKDERYMAISDLRGEIESLDVIDASMQTSMRQAMLRRLEDSSSDVQQIAVNCFSSMVEKFDPSQVIEIIGTLCNLSNIKSGSDLKEVYAEALRAVLEHVPWSLGEQVSNLLLPVLLGTLGCSQHRGTTKERDRNDERFWCLMLLQTVLERFIGSSIGDGHCQNILSILLHLLSSAEYGHINSLIPSVVASFTNFCPSYLLAKLVEEIISRISSDAADDKRAVLVLTLSDMARKAGPRLVQHSTSIIPIVEMIVLPARIVDFEDANEERVIIRYHSLVVLECLVKFGPQYVAPYCSSLLNAALTLSTLDPNFVEINDAETTMDEYDGDDWGLEPDIAPDEDAGDTNWKVRLAALRLLSEWINCRTFKGALISGIPNLLDRLIDRFNERDAAVQAQVFDTFTVLLKRMLGLSSEITIDDIAARYLSPIMSRLRHQIVSAKPEVKRSTASALLALLTLFGTRLFSESDEVLSFTLSEIVNKSDTSVQLIGLDTLKMVIDLLPRSRLRLMKVQAVVQSLIVVMLDDSVKLSVAPFDNVALLCKRLRPDDQQQAEITVMLLLYQPLFAIAKKLPSFPSEVHISACAALAEFCSCFGGSLDGTDFYNCVELFLSFVEIRSVELTGLQCLSIMSNSAISSVHAALEPHIGRIFKTLLDLVSGKGNDAIVISSYLSTMAGFVTRFSSSIPVSLLSDCLQICVKLEDPSTITAMHNLCAHVLNLSQERKFIPGSAVIPLFVDQAVRVLSHSDSQHRSSLQSSQALLMAISRLHSEKECLKLIARLVNAGSSPAIPLAAFGWAIAACLVARFDQGTLVEEIAKFLSPVDSNTRPFYLQLVLVIVGDVARLSPLPEPFLVKLFSFLSSYINYGDEHVKSSAATSLGACTAANPATLLALLLDRVVQSETGSVCFPLHALKEVLISVDPHRISSDIADTILPILLRHSESDDEGVRAIASECIGKLLALHRDHLSPQIQSGLRSPSRLLRASIVTAVKFYYAQMRDEGIPAESLLPLLHDSDLSVKRQAFLALIALLNSTKSVTNLDSVLDNLACLAAQQIQFRTDLIRKIDFGAFQETVDDGLLLRQAAYSCLRTVTELYPDHISPKSIIITLAEHGVNDPDLELQCSAYDIMTCIASNLSPGFSIGFFEELSVFFLPAVKNRLAQVKRNSADSDSRRVLSAFIIAVHQLHSLPGVKADCPRFHSFYLQVLKTSLLSDILHEHGLLDSKI